MGSHAVRCRYLRKKKRHRNRNIEQGILNVDRSLALHNSKILVQYSKPPPPFKNKHHPNRDKQHQSYRNKKTPIIMQQGNDIKIHPENASNNSGRSQQTGYDCHYFHHLVQFQIHRIKIKIL